MGRVARPLIIISQSQSARLRHQTAGPQIHRYRIQDTGYFIISFLRNSGIAERQARHQCLIYRPLLADTVAPKRLSPFLACREPVTEACPRQWRRSDREQTAGVCADEQKTWKRAPAASDGRVKGLKRRISLLESSSANVNVCVNLRVSITTRTATMQCIYIYNISRDSTIN